MLSRDREGARVLYSPKTVKHPVDPKDPAFFSPFPDVRYLFTWRDRKKTLEEIAGFSKRDAERYPAYEDHVEGLARTIEPPPNLPPGSVGDLIEYARLAGACASWAAGKSPP